MPRPSIRHFFVLILALAASLTAFAQREKFSIDDLVVINSKYPEAKKLITGVRYVIHTDGTGDCARPGDELTVLYKGTLIDGRVFNECLDPKSPFTFRLGRGQVIEGWEQAFKHLNVGAKATILIPYEYAYGTRGNPPLVPKQSSLIFEVEVLKIERGSQPPPLPEDPKKKKK